MIPLALLWRYFRTRKLHFTDREALENWQAKRLHQFRQNVLSHSPWFQRYLTLPFNQWPMMDKALMMTHFDEMNTAGLKRDELLDCAMRSEQSRDLKPALAGSVLGFHQVHRVVVGFLLLARTSNRCGPPVCWQKCCPTVYLPKSGWRCFCARTTTCIKA